MHMHDSRQLRSVQVLLPVLKQLRQQQQPAVTPLQDSSQVRSAQQQLATSAAY
jgi:hypothetical protein